MMVLQACTRSSLNKRVADPDHLQGVQLPEEPFIAVDNVHAAATPKASSMQPLAVGLQCKTMVSVISQLRWNA
jgi:hypothetical protein